MSGARQKKKRANAAASTPFLTLGGFSLLFGILTSAGLYVDALGAASPAFGTPGFLVAAAGGTTFIAMVFYYREKRRLP